MHHNSQSTDVPHVHRYVTTSCMTQSQPCLKFGWHTYARRVPHCIINISAAPKLGRVQKIVPQARRQASGRPCVATQAPWPRNKQTNVGWDARQEAERCEAEMGEGEATGKGAWLLPPPPPDRRHGQMGGTATVALPSRFALESQSTCWPGKGLTMTMPTIHRHRHHQRCAALRGGWRRSRRGSRSWAPI